MDRLGAVIPAAGQGRRMGAGINKQFLLLDGVPVIAHTIKTFQISELVSEIVVVGAQQDIPHLDELVQLYAFSKVSAVVVGGETRQESVYAGIKALGRAVERVVIHDGARPLLTPAQLESFLKAGKGCDAAIMAMPLKDTIKKIDKAGLVAETPSRSELVAVQTPQVFERSLLEKAHAAARARAYAGTDDASLVEWLGHPVQVLEGYYENIKITTPEDLWLAEAVLARRRQP